MTVCECVTSDGCRSALEYFAAAQRTLVNSAVEFWRRLVKVWTIVCQLRAAWTVARLTLRVQDSNQRVEMRVKSAEFQPVDVEA
jgi:hypothetical protein